MRDILDPSLSATPAPEKSSEKGLASARMPLPGAAVECLLPLSCPG